ncbi:type I-E CRISPR-associated endoribonuclease Cas2 [Streptomyces sp. NPDC056049]|uniref:type I-E CRISPR-associated endoribonuclease Cas2 n=1 Tax=Streptomyces sp. NPDC056049 TaxID=3345693 RepID=UPI0035E2375D
MREPSAIRLRDRLWQTLTARIGTGRAIMIEPAGNEQRWSTRTASQDRWTPVDYGSAGPPVAPCGGRPAGGVSRTRPGGAQSGPPGRPPGPAGSADQGRVARRML